MLFSQDGVKPARLDQDQVLTTAMVVMIFAEYGSCYSKVHRESGDGFERRPALLSEVVDIVHQETLAFRYFKGATRIDDAASRNGLERVARVNRDTDEVNLVNSEMTCGYCCRWMRENPFVTTFRWC